MDGDTDTVPVQEDFKNVVQEHIAYIKESRNNEMQTAQVGNNHYIPNGVANGHANGHIPNDTVVQDLEAEPIETISRRVGNRVQNGVAHAVANGVVHMANGHGPTKNGVANGHVRNGDLPVYSKLDINNHRNNYTEVVNYMDGQI